MKITNIIREIKKPKYNSDNHLLRIEINKSNLLNNISNVRNLIGDRKLGAVLKGNAYGHGLIEMGRFLDKVDSVDLFFVDNIVEARLLRDYGIKKDIVILGYVPIKTLSQLKKLKRVILVVNSYLQAQDILNEAHFDLNVYLKLDTGMNRHGISYDKFENAINILKDADNINIRGMMTHLADADNKNSEKTINQLEKWKDGLKIYKSILGGNGDFHFSATSGLEYIDNYESNMVRLGIGMYGFDTTKDKVLNVKSILSFWAKVVNIKKLNKGDGIGYGFTYEADKDINIYTLPCGYSEGVPRCLSNKGCVYFGDKKMNILGRVSMNLITVGDGSQNDYVSDLENIEAEVFSNNPKKENSVENIAKLCETIPYEIVSGLSKNIVRVFK